MQFLSDKIMDNLQQLNSIGSGGLFPIKLTKAKDQDGNIKMIPKLEVHTDDQGKEYWVPVMEQKTDEEGNLVFYPQRDAQGNIIYDASGNPIPDTNNPWMIPVMVERVGWYPVYGDINLVKQNLIGLLSYMIGQKIRSEYYGTLMWDSIEEPNTIALGVILRKYLSDSIKAWEPRLIAMDLRCIRQFDSIHLVLKFAIKDSRSIYDLDFSYNPQTNSIYVNH